MHFPFHPGVRKLPFLVVVEEMTVQGQHGLKAGPSLGSCCHERASPLPLCHPHPAKNQRPPFGPSQAAHTRLFSTTTPALTPSEPANCPTSLLQISSEHSGVAMHGLRREDPEPDSVLTSTYICWIFCLSLLRAEVLKCEGANGIPCQGNATASVSLHTLPQRSYKEITGDYHWSSVSSLLSSPPRSLPTFGT